VVSNLFFLCVLCGKKLFFAKQTQFQKSEKCPNSFSYRWLLKAGGWMLSKKQTQTKPISITDNG
jgi:hypothetical protein